MKTETYTNKETNESVEVAHIDPWTVATLDDEGEVVEQGKSSKIIGMLNRAGFYSEEQISARAYYKRNPLSID